MTQTPAVPLYLPPEEVAKWTRGLAAFDRQNEAATLALFSAIGIPDSYLDVGSGTGAMVNCARKLGVDAWGLDALPRGDTWPHLLQHDLRIPFDFGRTFSVVSSIETAEHIEAESADTLCDTIARHVEMGGILIFTAAPPGQEGDHHVNVRPAVYWRKHFFDRGFHWNGPLTWRLVAALGLCNHSQHHIEANLQAFIRRE